MKGYAATEVFSKVERQLLIEAKKIVARLPLKDSGGRYVRCHEVARLVGTILGLQVTDGHYGMVEHSWLWTSKFEPLSLRPNVLDAYVVGRMPLVQLVHTSAHLPFEYRRGDKRRDIRPKVMDELFRALKSKGSSR